MTVLVECAFLLQNFHPVFWHFNFPDNIFTTFLSMILIQMYPNTLLFILQDVCIPKDEGGRGVHHHQ